MDDYVPMRRQTTRKMPKWDENWQMKIDKQSYNDKVDMEELLNYVENLGQ